MNTRCHKEALIVKAFASLFRRCMPVLCLLGVLVPTAGHAQSRPEPPDLLAFQGNLVGADGLPIGASGTVNYPMVFRIYDNDTGGVLLWSEQQTIPVIQGAFAALLGEGTPYAGELRPALSSIFRSPTASDRFIEITVRGFGTDGSDLTVAPRTRLVSGAFSLLATHARTAQNLVNASGQPILRPVGDQVGINKANPTAALDVAGSIRAKGLALQTDWTASGIGRAKGFSGLGMAPVGSILMWTGSTPPEGWVLCDGALVKGFKTPDLRGRFVVGAGNGVGLSPRPLNQVGGEEAHALSEAEIPAHSHLVALTRETSSQASGSHGYRSAIAGFPLYDLRQPDKSNPAGPNLELGELNSSTDGAHSHLLDIPAFNSEPSGGGRPHNTMPPFYVLAFIIRVE